MPWVQSDHLCTLTTMEPKPVRLQVHEVCEDVNGKATGFLLLHDCHDIVRVLLNPRLLHFLSEGVIRVNKVIEVHTTSGQVSSLVLVSNITSYCTCNLSSPLPQEKICFPETAQLKCPDGGLLSLAPQPLKYLVPQTGGSTSTSVQPEPHQVPLSRKGRNLRIIYRNTFLDKLTVSQEQV